MSIAPSDPTFVTYWTTLTFVTLTPHGLTAGAIFNVTGNSLYNGSFQVLSVTNATTLVVGQISGDDSVGSGGTITGTLPSLVRTSNVVTATTSAAHQFYPGLQVSITGVTNTTIGGSISAIARANNVTTVTTTDPTGLTAGCTVVITGVTDTTFNGTFVVSSIITPTKFTYAQALADATDATGAVQDVWNGTFFIAACPSTTTFTYQQLGPNNNTAASGTATPLGQVVAGLRNAVCMFQTRQGYVTAPSAPIQFSADGSKHILVQNLPIGPPNVTARIIAFTATGGGNYFYIPVPAQLGGQRLSTSTVIRDNTSTSAILDFSDNTLLAGTAIDVSGNNLFAQVVLGPCLGVAFYAGRLFWWGEGNKIQNLKNMGFEGGYISGVLTTPLGWTADNPGGLLINGGSVGMAWQVTGPDDGRISQFCYQTYAGVRILTGDTQYTFRVWAQSEVSSQAGNIKAELYDLGTTTVLATATIPMSSVSTDGGFVQANFSVKTPVTIPTQVQLRVYVSGLVATQTAVLDEMEVIYTDNPYRETVFRVSYVNNPEAFDGVTGVLGPNNDPTPLRRPFNIRDNLYITTAERLHSTKDLASEPDEWQISQVAEKCGPVSAFALDSGEDWAIWATDSGARIFEGQQPEKVSQEIQNKWDLLNDSAKQFAWVANDPAVRRVYFGMPTGNSSTPDKVYVMDYRHLNTASQISAAGSLQISLAGKMVSSDKTRKWTIWNLPLQWGSVMNRPGLTREMCFSGINVYRLDPSLLTDDDYGEMFPYYTTYFFINHQMEQVLGVGSHRKIYVYLSAFFTGVGKMTVTPLADRLSNPFPSTPSYTMSLNQNFDLEWGLNVNAERLAFKFVPTALPNATDKYFSLQKMVVSMRQDPWMPVRGSVA